MTKFSLFTGDLIIYIENLTELIGKLLELLIMFGKDVRNKIDLLSPYKTLEGICYYTDFKVKEIEAQRS